MKQALGESTGLEPRQVAAIIEQLTTGVIVVNPDGRPTLVNAAARRLLGKNIDRATSIIHGAIAAGMRHARSGRIVSPESTPIARALRGETVLDEELTLPHGRDDQALRLRVTGLP